jgi:GNAT superfamily N-acetyltransferase
MKEEDLSTFSKKVIVTELEPKFVADFIKYNYFFSARARGDVLNDGLSYKMFQAVKLLPRATRLVAYHSGEKTAIGFLYLEENTNWLYTIEYVFVNPNYRKMGVATKLLKHALILAKEKGAKKVNLNVYSSSTKAINLYRKLGFREIGCTILGQGFLSGFVPSRLVRRVIMGQSCLTKLANRKKGKLFKISTNSRKNREILFNIYRRCMDREWVNFFEINADNLINGSRHVWQPPFFKNVEINNLGDTFALIYNRPFSSKATVELYSASKDTLPSILEDVLAILVNRGISFTQIWLFTPTNNAIANWFKEKKMRMFQFAGMGKTF